MKWPRSLLFWRRIEHPLSQEVRMAWMVAGWQDKRKTTGSWIDSGSSGRKRTFRPGPGLPLSFCP